MISKELLGALAILVAISSLIPYAVEFYLGKVKPHAFSWLIWGFSSAVVFAAQEESGAGPGAWISGFNTIACLLIAVLATRHGEREITRTDWAFFLAALSTVPLWALTQNPLAAVALITLIDSLAFYPTFRKSWRKPYEETLLTYAAYVLIPILAIMAMDQRNLTTLLSPVVMGSIHAAFVAMLVVRRRALKQKQPPEGGC